MWGSGSGRLGIQLQTTDAGQQVQLWQVCVSMAAECAVNLPVAILNVKRQAFDQRLLLVAGSNELEAILIFCVQHEKLRVGLEGPQSDLSTLRYGDSRIYCLCKSEPVSGC